MLDTQAQALSSMDQRGMSISRDAFYLLLQHCTQKKDLAAGRLVHSLMIRTEFDTLATLGDHLIRLFAFCGSLLEASLVFCKLGKPSAYTWHAIITAHITCGESERALELYDNMHKEGAKPGKFIFSSSLKACGNIGAIGQGRLMHEQIIRSGLDLDVVLGSSLVDMYVKCGNLDEAEKLFAILPDRNVVSWGAMIAGYVHFGRGNSALEIFQRMQREGIKPDKITLLCSLKACGTIRAVGQGGLIHEEIIRNGLESDVIICNALVDMYARCGSLEEAHEVFNELFDRNVVSYGTMIAGYTQHGHGHVALKLYENMVQAGVVPNRIIFLCILKACGCTGAIAKGRLIHNQLLKGGFKLDEVIGSALIDMYVKCGHLEEARKVLDDLLYRDVVSWGVMISGYAQHGHGVLALELFKKMQQEGIRSDAVTLLCLLKACGSIQALTQGRLIHEQTMKCGLDSRVIIGNSLIDMYARCGSLEEALIVLDQLPNPNVVSWNALIMGCSQHGHGVFAIKLFKEMQQDGIMPDTITFSLVLKACASVGAIEEGKEIHDQIMKSGFELELIIGTTLVDMYAKCGSLEEAQKILSGLPNRDVVSWNALIAGYAQHGNCRQAVQCLEDMKQQGLNPDSGTYASILAACSQVGAIDEAHGYLKSMREDHGITPGIEHLNSIIDLLGRAGYLNDAESLLLTKEKEVDIVGWRSLLTACKTYGNMDLGRQCFDQAVLVKPNSAAGYILMSNIYADAQMWDDVFKLQEERKSVAAWKKPGRAWIEVDSMVHEFIVGDGTHSETMKAHVKLYKLRRQLKEDNYVPQLDLLLKQVLNEPKEDILCDH